MSCRSDPSIHQRWARAAIHLIYRRFASTIMLLVKLFGLQGWLAILEAFVYPAPSVVGMAYICLSQCMV